jgi:hypothetical protein
MRRGTKEINETGNEINGYGDKYVKLDKEPLINKEINSTEQCPP